MADWERQQRKAGQLRFGYADRAIVVARDEAAAAATAAGCPRDHQARLGWQRDPLGSEWNQVLAGRSEQQPIPAGRSPTPGFGGTLVGGEEQTASPTGDGLSPGRVRIGREQGLSLSSHEAAHAMGHEGEPLRGRGATQPLDELRRVLSDAGCRRGIAVVPDFPAMLPAGDGHTTQRVTAPPDPSQQDYCVPSRIAGYGWGGAPTPFPAHIVLVQGSPVPGDGIPLQPAASGQAGAVAPNSPSSQGPERNAGHGDHMLSNDT